MKIGEHIKDVSRRTEKNFYRQLSSIGNMYDWSRTVETYKPEYYKWTQWLFLQLFKKGLAYQKEAKVNWCPWCKTVLSDEQVIQGLCERCDSQVEKKELKQWFFKITDYADRLLKNLEWIDWSEDVKTNQRNWIGKSEGARVKFKIKDSEENLEVFTTRPDTLFGATYMVLAPEHKLIEDLKDQIENWEEVEKYITQAKNKSEQERKEDEKEKTGVEVKGIKAINPVNNEEIPIWVADYVLAGYGTGAIMAVPAHDERDFDFAKKYGIEIRTVVAPERIMQGEGAPKSEKDVVCFEGVTAIVKHWKDDKYFAVEFKTGQRGFVGGRVEKGEDHEKAIMREVVEESGYEDAEIKEVVFEDSFSRGYKSWKSQEEFCHEKIFVINLKSDKRKAVDDKNIFGGHWMSAEEIFKSNFFSHHQYYLQTYLNKNKTFSDEGIAVNSGFLDKLQTKEAKKKIIEWLEEKSLGEKSTDYKLRDWCVSRQRYWGPPIPIIHCKKCGVVPVPEKDLPVELPDMEDFLPEGKGRGPLAKNKEFVNVKCPNCGEDAERETDVSDPFVDSAWYFLRYPSTEFDNEAINKDRAKKWLPVDSYIGGKEHTVLHLLYSRFITMVLKDLDYIEFEEPYKRFFGHGLITKDGAKMSKSKGNVINPDEMLEKYGADTVRLYLRFLGDFSQGGDWRDDGAEGMSRFIKKTWNLFFELGGIGSGVEKTHMIDRTIKIIGEDIDKLSFNTAVARYMEFINWIKDNSNKFNEEQVQKIKETMALVIAPMAPFIAEEFWLSLGNEKSIFIEKWPEYNEDNLEDDSFELVLQINGKVRDKIEVPRSISEEEAKEKALGSEKISKNLNGEGPRKIIYIKEKLINIVV
jgi:leucyl-tRNA synthetase